MKNQSDPVEQNTQHETIHNKATQSWYIGKVADVEDPDKRRRLRIRGPYEVEAEVPVDNLPWIQPFQTSKDNFQLPDKDESVLVLCFNRLKVWLELPEKENYNEVFNDSDYARGYLHAHKNVFWRQYTDSEGFDIYMVNQEKIRLTTDKFTFVQDGDGITLTYDNVVLHTDGSKYELKNNQTELCSDGTKFAMAGASYDLFTCLNTLLQTLQQEIHPTPMGPSSPPIQAPIYAQIQTQMQTFLKPSKQNPTGKPNDSKPSQLS